MSCNSMTKVTSVLSDLSQFFYFSSAVEPNSHDPNTFRKKKKKKGKEEKSPGGTEEVCLHTHGIS